MAYTLGNYYYIQSHGGTFNLYLNREGSGGIARNQNISIYKPTGTGVNKDHLFRLMPAHDAGEHIVGCTIRSALNEDYGLNIYGYGSSMTAEGNCDLYPVGGYHPNASNYADSLIDLITVDQANSLYKITLIKHPGLYLTPVGNYNNADVRWKSVRSEDAHIWKLCTSEEEGSGGEEPSKGDSPLVTKFIPADESNYNKNRASEGCRITEITIHHCAGNMTIESLGRLWQNPNRNGSSHYGVCDDQVGQFVRECDVAWTNGHRPSNWRAVTIETSNSGGAPDWPVSDKSLATLKKLVADIAKRNGLGKLVKEENLTWHQLYSATACPGPYLLSKIDEIVADANAINGY